MRTRGSSPASDTDDNEIRQWAKFDLFFGSFVVMNAISIGIETDHGDDA